MPFEILAHCGRTESFTIGLYQADGATAANLETGDTVRVKVGRDNASAPVLDLDSDNATDNGSSLTYTSGTDVVQLRLAQADTANISPGCYQLEIDVVDNGDTEVGGAAPVKLADVGVIYFVSTLGGAVGL